MAKTMKLQELKKTYEFACNEYVQKFCNKQGLDFDGWISDEIGGVGVFNTQYYFNIQDIALDLNLKAKKGLILDWQDDNCEHNIDKEDTYVMPYKNYINGERYEK